MINRIFKNTFVVSIVTVLVTYGIIVGILYDYFDNQIKQELKTQAEYIACGINGMGEEYLKQLSVDAYTKNKKDIGMIHKNRITWIEEDGTVLYDSDVEAEEMENHKDRKEFVNALANGEEFVTRYSNTLDEQTVYYALALADGTVLRISSAYNTVFSILLAMLQPTAFLIFLVIFISYWMSKRAAKKIVEPINNIDLLYGEMEEEYEELVPLLKRIRHQNIQIEEQINALKTQQAKFKALTEHMQEGFLVLDREEKILSYNGSAVELLGAAKDMDYIGKNLICFDRNRNVREVVEKALGGERNETTLEVQEHIYRILANPIILETQEGEQQVDGVIAIVMDETEKEKREQLRREFTSNVSHELKTPLTSISGVAEIMMNGIVKTEDIPDFAKNIYEEAGRLIDLVNDIIFLSKLDENRAELTKSEVLLRQLAIRTKERLQLSCKEKQVAIHIVGNEVAIEGIPSMLEEIFYNLLDNGLKYNNPGGKVAVIFSVVKKDEKDMAQIEVEDTGIGIPQESLERIFERFYRVDKSHSKAVGGTGLGLSIVKHVVLLHNGEIRAESKMGQGTKITVLLPVKG